MDCNIHIDGREEREMYTQMWYREWTLRAWTGMPTVSKKAMVSAGRRLWVWFWRQCIPPRTGFVGRPI
jgi:hypothetical protein